ncbi:Uma2 family endonuclease [Thermosynechococcus sp. HN-54]|uniref:Uma2 family endonuclease n=1 Tax=Thermosynechococcus sp. HN-54 TaxID=2933959 RepID=UPI00202CE3FF|nr:Uma2 family endonuclease [Thermosynechococcus sp. HN-54]URR34994.1 Uma2 family endonuclease [Thermosynechococcus sp. HN-54]
MNSALPVYLPKTIRFTEEQFAEIIKANPNLRFELTASGELIAMPPTGGETGRYNAALTADISLWNRQTQLGEVFDSSTEFRLPNGAIRSPDVAWIAKERWQRLSPEERQGFVPLCPDFIIELASPNDELSHLRAKMQEYIDHGCRLGWLIVPQQHIAEIYCPQHTPESVSLPATLSGEEILPHFSLAFSHSGQWINQ